MSTATKSSTSGQNGVHEETDLLVLFGTTTGASKTFGEKLVKEAEARGVVAQLLNMKEYEPEDLQDESATCVFVVSTYEGGTPPKDAMWMHKWLDDSRNDHRVDKRLLRSLKYTVFGLGNSLYDENFNVTAQNFDEWLLQLGATRVAVSGCGDENVADSKHGGQEKDYVAWKRVFWKAARPQKNANRMEIFVGAAEAIDSDDEHADDDDSADDNADGSAEGSGRAHPNPIECFIHGIYLMSKW